jgi:hypothetical protein
MQNGPATKDDVPAHVRDPEEKQAQMIRAMTPHRRLELARDLYGAVWKIKLAGLPSQHPDWSDHEVATATRLVFLTGYAGA